MGSTHWKQWAIKKNEVINLESIWGWVVDLEELGGSIEVVMIQIYGTHERKSMKNNTMLYFKMHYILVTLRCNKTSEFISPIV